MHAVPPVSLLGKVISKLSDHLCRRVILIALGCPNMPWFWELVDLLTDTNLSLNPCQSGDSPIQWDTSQVSSQSQSSCMAPRVEAIKKQSPVAVLIETPQRS